MMQQWYGVAVRLGVAGALATISLPAVVAAAPVTPGPAPDAATLDPWKGGSNQQLLFEWRGRVDKEIRIEMRGDRTNIDRVGNKEWNDGRIRTSGSLPAVDAPIRVEADGRGRVDVVQQPTRGNGYTAIVRIRDPQSGASDYRIRAYTTASTRNGRGNGHGRWGNGRNDDDHGRHRGRDRDGDDDRNDRNDRNDRDNGNNPIGNFPWPI